MDDISGTQRTPGREPLAVKSSSTRDPGYFYVNWWLTDHCNYDCSYCHDVLKNGNVPFVAIRDVKDFIDQVNAYCLSIGLKMHLDITGGEVTQYPFLDLLLEHASEYGAYIKIRTNASQSLAAFTETIKHLSLLELEFHPEHTQTSHFMLCLNKAGRQEGLSVIVNLNALPERFHEVEELHRKIKDKWPHFDVKLKMLFEDPVKNTQPMIYQESQLVVLKRQSGTMILEYADDWEYTDYQTAVLENKNQFQDWQCRIGIEQIIVDAWGTVRRGHCRQGGSIGRLGQPIRFDKLEITCKKSHCVNGFDILATKTRPV